MQYRVNTGDLVKIFPGKFHPISSPSKQKVIVFDLDETLGYFSDLVDLWYVIALKKTQHNFNALLDQYPEFLRYGILTILEYLNHKKHAGKCYKLYLYTNNRYSPEIPRYIAKYFDYKMGIYRDIDDLTKTHLFDKVICAFKIGNRIIEPGRTTHKKTHSDFIRCTLLPKNTEICFIDDVYHGRMNHSKIYYIQPCEYYHNLGNDEIIRRACAFMPDVYNRDYLEYLFSNNNYNLSHTTNETNIQVSQKIMYYIKEFFYLSSTNTKTRKSRYRLGRFTRKR
jgi:hypothetical protein